MAAQELGWDKGSHESAQGYAFLYGNGSANHQWGQALFVHHGIRSAVKEAEFISDRVLRIMLRGRWCHIIFLNVR